MAIRWDKEFKKEIRRELDKVNKKFARARKMGFTKVPENIGMKELKKQFGSKYANRRELRRVVAQYRKSSIEDLTSTVNFKGGGSMSKAMYNITEQRRRRLKRMNLKSINKLEGMINRAGGDVLPFARDELSRLKNLDIKLSKKADYSESQAYFINQMNANVYSSVKKDSFEYSLRHNMNEQLDNIKLSADPAEDAKMKATIKNYVNNTDVDQLINMNKNDDEFGDINDRYKKNNSYTVEDNDALENAYKSIYEKITSGFYDNLYGE